MTITASERGRRLVITIAAGTEDELEVVVKPLPTSVGGELLSSYTSILFGQVLPEKPEQYVEGSPEWIAASNTAAEEEARKFSKLALGEENWGVIEDLRWDEAEPVINAAFFWNVQGGGIDVVNELLRPKTEGGGLPKAREMLLESVGLSEAFGQLQTLLRMELGNQTNAAGTPATTTRPTSSAPSRGTVDKLPPSRRSVRQNQP